MATKPPTRIHPPEKKMHFWDNCPVIPLRTSIYRCMSRQGRCNSSKSLPVGSGSTNCGLTNPKLIAQHLYACMYESMIMYVCMCVCMWLRV